MIALSLIIALALVGLFGLLLWAFTPWRVSGLALSAATLAAMWAVWTLPVGDGMIAALSSRFPPFTPDDRPVTGIILIGGFGWAKGPDGQLVPSPKDIEDRRLDALALARRYPTARILVCGGPSDPSTPLSDAELVERYFVTQGVAPGRFILEGRSTTTYENAHLAYPLAQPKAGERWLLVTSRWHMPRAMGTFRKAGFPVIAAPTTVRGVSPDASTRSSQLHRVDVAFKEIGGLLIYNLLGRTSALYPAP